MQNNQSALLKVIIEKGKTVRVVHPLGMGVIHKIKEGLKAQLLAVINGAVAYPKDINLQAVALNDGVIIIEGLDKADHTLIEYIVASLSKPHKAVFVLCSHTEVDALSVFPKLDIL